MDKMTVEEERELVDAIWEGGGGEGKKTQMLCMKAEWGESRRY